MVWYFKEYEAFGVSMDQDALKTSLQGRVLCLAASFLIKRP